MCNLIGYVCQYLFEKDIITAIYCELDEADEPRLHGKPFCSYVLQRVLEEARRVWRG